jgi:hypothetical protein
MQVIIRFGGKKGKKKKKTQQQQQQKTIQTQQRCFLLDLVVACLL